MIKEEIEQKVINLNYYIDKERIRKSGAVLFLGVSLVGIIGGGFIMGLILGKLAKITMLAIAAAALVGVVPLRQIGSANAEIKRCRHQIKEYQNTIKGMESTKVARTEVKEVKEEYAYKPTNDVAKETKPPVKIETFSEADFEEEATEEQHKSR